MRFVGWSFGFVFVSDYAWLCAGLRLVVFRVAPNCDGLFVSAFFFYLLCLFLFFLFYFFIFFGCREFGVVSRLSRVWRGFEVVTMYHTHIHTYITHIVHKSQMYPLTSAPSNSPPHPTRIYFSIFLCIFLKVSVQEGEGRRACINEGMRMCCGVSIRTHLSLYVPCTHSHSLPLTLPLIPHEFIFLNFFLSIFLKVSVQEGEGEGRRACINEGMRMCCGVSIYFLSTYIPVLHLKYAYLRLASISNIYINF